MSRPPTLAQSQAKSRHRFQVETSWRLTHVATSNWGRDTAQSTPGRDLLTGSRHRFSWSFTYVATSFPCRNLVPAHSGTSRLRHQNPCRYLPHCRPCRDIKSMSRRRFRPAKADQVATPLPARDLTLLLKASSMSQPRPTSPSLNQTRSRPHTGIWQ